MSKYSVDFDITSVELLPIHKRISDIQNVMYALAAPLNESERIFQYLREGTSAGDYSGATTYTFGQLVNYQRRVYYKNEVTDGYTSGIAPNNTTYFVKVLDYTIGLNDRIRFANGKLILEYALNAILGTTFNQPPVLSDVYIVRESNDYDTFSIGETDADTSTISENDQDSTFGIPEVELAIADPYDYTIYVPVAVWTALAGTSTERNNIVLTIASKYRLIGFTPRVLTY